MFAGEQPAFAVPCQAIRLVARIPEFDHAAIRRPAAYPVARHVAEQQVFARGVPQRTFGKQKTGAEFLEFNRRADNGLERRMTNFNGHGFAFPAAAF
jgi:hypothetical protein